MHGSKVRWILQQQIAWDVKTPGTRRITRNNKNKKICIYTLRLRVELLAYQGLSNFFIAQEIIIAGQIFHASRRRWISKLFHSYRQQKFSHHHPPGKRQNC